MTESSTRGRNGTLDYNCHFISLVCFPFTYRFSFGLGKRSVVPSFGEDKLEDLISQMKMWGRIVPNGLFKKRDREVNQEKLTSILAQLKLWGLYGPHGLFKRGEGSPSLGLNRLYSNIGKWGLAGPHGLFKKRKMDDENMYKDEENIQVKKRGTYSFGLGKRNVVPVKTTKDSQYNYSLGKRNHLDSGSWNKRGSHYSFGLGKRTFMGKRNPYGFGLGK